MNLNDTLTQVLDATSFQRGARAVLTAVEHHARASDEEGAVYLRGSIHLRHRGAYVGIAQSSQEAHAEGAAHSATAWGQLTKHTCVLAVDALTKRMGPIDQPTDQWHHASQPGAMRDTKRDFEQRGVTHMLVFPIRNASGAIGGMLSVEFAALRHSGNLLPGWQTCRRDLERLARVVCPHLFRLQADAAVSVEPPPDWASTAWGLAWSQLRLFEGVSRPLLITGARGSGRTTQAKAFAERIAGSKLVVLLPLRGMVEDVVESALANAVARAAGGVVILDDIDRASIGAQRRLAFLLRNEAWPTVPTRWVSVAADDIRHKASQGTFDASLFDQLSALQVRMPTLEERGERELDHWCQTFVRGIHGDAEVDASVQVSKDAVAWLSTQVLPRNLAQLRASIEAAYGYAIVESRTDRVVVDKAHLVNVLVDRTQPMEAIAPTLETLAAQVAATALAAEALDRHPRSAMGKGVFEGMVWRAAVEQGGKKRAAHALGHGTAFTNNNLSKTVNTPANKAITLFRDFIKDLGQ